jgi:hypothetical protein
MTRTLGFASVTGLLLAAAFVLRVSAAQDRTAQPGQPTQGRAVEQIGRRGMGGDRLDMPVQGGHLVVMKRPR